MSCFEGYLALTIRSGGEGSRPFDKFKGRSLEAPPVCGTPEACRDAEHDTPISETTAHEQKS
jgi:hypothetical protein